MKAIVTGYKGLLATNIMPFLEEHYQVIPFDIDEWDITDRGAGEEIIRSHRPDVLVNLAAMTDVDGCEDRIELAERVNGYGAGVIAELCGRHGIRLVHVSTDYVFDGGKGTPYVEEDEPNPQSVYGRTKLLGEQFVMKSCPSATIMRTQWLYGKGGTNFITKIIDIAKERGRVDVVDDQRGSPTYTKDLAEPIGALIEKGRPGVYHAANGGFCTWFQFAGEIFTRMKMDVEVRPITSDKLNRKARRPACSAFDCSKLERDTGIRMRAWQDALEEYLR
jgi:dTDP-4-dehydrorhamnose reductase